MVAIRRFSPKNCRLDRHRPNSRRQNLARRTPLCPSRFVSYRYRDSGQTHRPSQALLLDSLLCSSFPLDD